MGRAIDSEAGRLPYKRIMIKISGEALMGRGAYGIDLETVEQIAKDLKEAREAGVEVAAVIGGGNIFRGLQAAAHGMERATADYVGMLATIMNALTLQNALEREGIHSRVVSAIPMTTVCEP
jgi:uridylate kinase